MEVDLSAELLVASQKKLGTGVERPLFLNAKSGQLGDTIDTNMRKQRALVKHNVRVLPSSTKKI